MTIEYKVTENDYLTYQLFVASKSARIKKKRQRSKVLVPLIYIVLGLWFYFDDQYSLTIIFMIIGLLWFFIYPLWERHHYINHYKGFIKEHYINRIDETATLEISNEFIFVKDNGNEAKVLTKEIEEINEIPSTIYIRLKGGQSFILPKDNITNIQNIKMRLEELADYLKINYIIEENWVWK